MTEIATLRNPQPYQQGRLALVFHVRLHGAPARGERRRFYRRMRGQLAKRGYLMGQSAGFCAVIPEQGQAPRLARHGIVNWMIDQNSGMTVAVFEPTEICALIFGTFSQDLHQQLLALSMNSPADGAASSEDSAIHKRGQKYFGQTLLRRITEGVLLQSLYRWQALQPCIKEDANA